MRAVQDPTWLPLTAQLTASISVFCQSWREHCVCYNERLAQHRPVFSLWPPACAQTLDSGLYALHVPYSYGFAIILLTVLVKALTFPLSRKQVRPHPLRCIPTV